MKIRNKMIIAALLLAILIVGSGVMYTKDFRLGASNDNNVIHNASPIVSSVEDNSSQNRPLPSTIADNDASPSVSAAWIMPLQTFQLVNGEAHITVPYKSQKALLLSVQNTGNKSIDIHITSPDSITPFAKASIPAGKKVKYTLSSDAAIAANLHPLWDIYAHTIDGSAGSVTVSVRTIP
ncbi:hypothetical protein [Paenibacillus wulumuqiensis]|uniref:hypothetical protein n=1 Tax=Paenibacillus wulumuqiensis TaxID=1567107 RepID=UPI000619822D|nr:hypothetical protein [Paenibacillus wulumuqiensis]